MHYSTTNCVKLLYILQDWPQPHEDVHVHLTRNESPFLAVSNRVMPGQILAPRRASPVNVPQAPEKRRHFPAAQQCSVNWPCCVTEFKYSTTLLVLFRELQQGVLKSGSYRVLCLPAGCTPSNRRAAVRRAWEDMALDRHLLAPAQVLHLREAQGGDLKCTQCSRSHFSFPRTGACRAMSHPLSLPHLCLSLKLSPPPA